MSNLFYEIKDWVSNSSAGLRPQKAYNDCFCLLVVRSGEFLFDFARQQFDLRTGHVLVDKPDYEFTLRPMTGQFTVINFSSDFYEQAQEDLPLRRSHFFSNPDLLTTALLASPEIEHRHFQLLQSRNAGKLATDMLAVELVRAVGRRLPCFHKSTLEEGKLSKAHFSAIEQAKHYLLQNFSEDLTLFNLASVACQSPFHFSRIFKQATGVSPHRYLLDIRLSHADLLLKNTTKSVTDIALASGFGSVEHFSTAFRAKFRTNPRNWRHPDAVRNYVV